MRMLTALPALVSVLLSASAFGQSSGESSSTGTAENAHKFLIAVLPTRFAGQSKGFGSHYQFPISRVESSACTTTIFFSGAADKFIIDWTKVAGISWEYGGSGADNGKVLIPSGVSGVDPNGQPTTLALPIGLQLGSTELMYRVEKAAKAIQRSCDPGAGLGF